MLVVTTLFLNVSSSLPATDYTKYMDFWLILGIVSPFFDIVIHTLAEHFNGQREVEMTLKVL